ncbi:TAXI family TRAP transporter solute-binding subunit [Nocardioides limicola]|uniref:TAXI family TRAP transporter solute-binding subunit n=1 Tax=Nocardioides limicola TaxID=2803368 RepID=UPI00193C437C|nr:TAXI family TRAP transporter solute-binding subunit [Nocardioides sp. DJM-14]
MRKLTRLAAAVAAGLLATTAACSAGTDDAEGDGGPLSVMVLGTGSVGGTYYPLGGAIAQMWNGSIDGLTVSTVASGASVENLVNVNNGDIQLGMAVNGTATQAINSQGAFEGQDMDFTFLGNIYPEVMQIVARADSGIETVSDLAGKRVAIGPDGSGTQGLALAILEAAGAEPASTFADGFGDAGAKLRDGQIDAAFGILALPDGTLTEVAQSVNVVMVTIPDDIRAALEENDPTLSTLDIPGGTYPGVAGDAVTVTNWATLYGPRNLDEDQVYDLVKSMYEQADEVNHAVAASIRIETALDGLFDIDIHPGAERYYREVGALE